MEKLNVFWMRRDLRLHDNHALCQALREDFPVLVLFVLDREILDELPKDDARLNLIYDALETIDSQLQKEGSSLLVKHGEVETVFKAIQKTYDIQTVFTNEDYEPYAIQRDQMVADLLAKSNIQFKTFTDQVIHPPQAILKSDGSPYQVFTPYMKAWRKQFDLQKLDDYPSEKHLRNLAKLDVMFPSLESFGYQRKAVDLPKLNWDESFIRDYENTRDIPSVNGTSRMSVHLRFGLISIRRLMRYSFLLSDVFVNELIWREFYMMILFHYPNVVDSAFKPQYDQIPWRNSEGEFKAWCEGKTGFPIVDAGMRQLNETGYMHNRLRMITASFLVKDLLIDWRWGEAYFAEKLLDFDLSANNGGWQWAAGTGCDAAPYFRIFNPDSQQKKFDPQMQYIKAWIPELNTPSYPKPIVDHKKAREITLAVYKAALNAN